MNDNRLRSTARIFEELQYGSVIMADEIYLKCHPERMSNDKEYIFVPHYSLGVFSAQEVAEMIIDEGCDWRIITPDN